MVHTRHVASIASMGLISIASLGVIFALGLVGGCSSNSTGSGSSNDASFTGDVGENPGSGEDPSSLDAGDADFNFDAEPFDDDASNDASDAS